ncbi:alpha-ketoglutarate-dependent dioxygenase alkB homolog 3-like [Pseudoliparis swirei]|uniref:alpha-ketoglutarate-dependent dioxygenase alkB homolog 3-like n=1 Tax=Pseudoliparis swirei TaxID=2059687 RepID=UPI0024BE72F4|nr:alpha-ketoglutarate-dependent dioxygenase alkB homolog 3-like [Pseudoliparis swirei]
MSDKRQRARVQGSWAKQPPKHSGPTGAVPNRQPPNNINPDAASWGSGPQKTPTTFEFNQPTKQVRDVPPVKVIEQAGVHEISRGPVGVSRLRLLPGFLAPEEADWMFSKLLAELPWSQKTNYRQGGVGQMEEILLFPEKERDSITNKGRQAERNWISFLG